MAKEEYRFKLSDLMPNSWFYKLKGMRRGGNRSSKGCRTDPSPNSMYRSQIKRTEPSKSLTNPRRNQPSPSTQPCITNRASYYIPTRDRVEKLPLSPTHYKAIVTDKKHEEKPMNTSNNLMSSVSSALTCRSQSSPVLSSQPAIGHQLHSFEEDFKNELFVISTESSSATKNVASDLYPPPPILTKPRLLAERKQSPKLGNLPSNGGIKRSCGSQQIKLRIKSPKLAIKIAQKKKGLGESFVVVKSSSDPQRDFRESMVEMIVENNLWSCKDLEDLLACYLSLNSSEYHDLIVKIFKQIWFDLTELLS